MKTSFVPIPIIAFAVIGCAHAQDGVSLYGIMSSGFSYMTSNAGASPGMAGGGLAGNRWGIRGGDSLGGGVDAVFRLENGFSPLNGKLAQGGRAFGRQAVIGLSSRRWGTVTFGRSYDPLVDLTQGLTAETFGSSPFATPGDVDNNDDTARVSNAVKYLSPTIAGLQLEAMAGFGGIAGAAGEGGTASAAASYTYGAFSVAGGYCQARNAHAPTGRRSEWSGASSDSIFTGGAINAGYVSARAIAIAQLAARYATALMTLGAGYSTARYRPDGQSTFATTQRFDTGRVFGKYQARPDVALALGYAYTRAGGDAAAGYHQISAGADYALSRRTDLYAEGVWQRASGTQRKAAGAFRPAVASISSYGIDGGRWQALAMAGIRHRF